MAEQEIARLTRQANSAHLANTSSLPRLKADIDARRREIENQRKALNTLREELEYDQDGIEILEDVGTLP